MTSIKCGYLVYVHFAAGTRNTLDAKRFFIPLLWKRILNTKGQPHFMCTKHPVTSLSASLRRPIQHLDSWAMGTWPDLFDRVTQNSVLASSVNDGSQNIGVISIAGIADVGSRVRQTKHKSFPDGRRPEETLRGPHSRCVVKLGTAKEIDDLFYFMTITEQDSQIAMWTEKIASIPALRGQKPWLHGMPVSRSPHI
jgi:hypothetical protein